MSAARLDALAQRVLRAAGWSTPLARAAEDDASGPAPHLDELERALGIRLPPPMTASGGGGGGGVRACTAPGEMWTWTPRTDAVHNAYAPACGGGGGDDGRATLEELAPFPPACYCSLGELAVEAFHPAGASPAAAGVVAAAATATTSFEALHGLERYSLPREMPSVRVARILLAWQELDSSDAGFFDRLLRGDDGGRRVPLLAALLRHWSALPRTEHGLRVLARAYGARLPTDASRYREYCAHCRTRGTVLPAVGPGGSVGDGGSTGGEWRPSPAVASFLGERALRVEALKLRLETEWAAHVSGAGKEASRGGAGEGGLPALLGCVYAASDAEARGRCRRWLGGWLRAFALGGGGVGATGAAPDGDCAAGHDAFGPAAAAFWPLLVGAASSAEAAPSRSFAAPRRGSPLGVEDTSAAGIDALLRILLRIVRGFQPLADPATAAAVGRRSRSLRPSHERLLFDVVLPLHRPEGLVLWRDQTPLLALYHETLVAVLAAFLAIDPALVGPVVGALLRPDVWPGEGRGGGNTPKTVLLLHEIDTLLGLPSNDIEEAGSGEAAALATALDACLPPLVARLCACIASENSRTAERALQFFRNRQFQRLVRRRRDKVGHLFLRALCRCPGWEVPWNPTVRKMTLLVLHELEGYYDGEESFGQACEAAFEGMDSASSAKTPATGKAGEKAIGTARVDRLSGSGPNIAGNMTSIRAAMGSWRPPSKAGGRPGNVAPPGKCVAPWASTRGQSHQGIPKASANGAPLTVTGVAPWAMTNPGGLPPQRQPPSTITGVAPWAMKKSESIPLPSRKSPAHPNIALPRPSKKHISGAPGPSLLKFPGVDAQVDIAEVEENNSYIAGQKKTALEEVRAYIEKLKPKGDDESNEDGVSSWAKVQMEESPVLLPHLKFHDLVFGQDLGTGAFGTVRYARHIVKTKTRSRWPEYAVKVVSTAKIKEMGYEQCVNREIATLRALSHPGIARLVSSFRFRDGAYLILEYASRGDLHSLLRRNGSLDHDSAGFVVGSVAAALGHVHDLGFVYGDCKPEVSDRCESGACFCFLCSVSFD